MHIYMHKSYRSVIVYEEAIDEVHINIHVVRHRSQNISCCRRQKTYLAGLSQFVKPNLILK